MFEFKHINTDTVAVFSSCELAISYFEHKGWGMWHWAIKHDGKQITLKEFNILTDAEVALRRSMQVARILPKF